MEGERETERQKGWEESESEEGKRKGKRRGWSVLSLKIRTSLGGEKQKGVFASTLPLITFMINV